MMRPAATEINVQSQHSLHDMFLHVNKQSDTGTQILCTDDIGKAATFTGHGCLLSGHYRISASSIHCYKVWLCLKELLQSYCLRNRLGKYKIYLI